LSIYLVDGGILTNSLNISKGAYYWIFGKRFWRQTW